MASEVVLVKVVVQVLEANDLAPTEPEPQLKQEPQTLVEEQDKQYWAAAQEAVYALQIKTAAEMRARTFISKRCSF